MSSLIISVMIRGEDSGWELRFSSGLPVPDVGDQIRLDYSTSEYWEDEDYRDFRVLARAFWYGDDDVHVTLRVEPV